MNNVTIFSLEERFRNIFLFYDEFYDDFSLMMYYLSWLHILWGALHFLLK